MKPGGKDGKLYKIVKETVVEGGIDTALEKSGFYRILAVGSSSSLPQPSSEAVAKGSRALGAGDVTHLWKCQEATASTLLSIHNIKFLIDFAKQCRQAILEDRYADFYAEHYYNLLGLR